MTLFPCIYYVLFFYTVVAFPYVTTNIKKYLKKSHLLKLKCLLKMFSDLTTKHVFKNRFC